MLQLTKTSKAIALAVILTFGSETLLNATPSSMNDTLVMQVVKIVSDNSYYEEEEGSGARCPEALSYYHIDKITGVVSETGFNTYILLYEIFDSNKNLIFESFDEDTFIRYLYSLSGEYEIKLHDKQYIYIGYISL